MPVESCDQLEVETAFCVPSDRCSMMNLPLTDQTNPIIRRANRCHLGGDILEPLEYPLAG